MTSNNTFQTPQTLRNFDDFNNMFKGIDRASRPPSDTARMVLNKVELEWSPSRSSDMDKWFRGLEYSKIIRNVDFSADEEEDIQYDSDFYEVSDIED